MNYENAVALVEEKENVPIVQKDYRFSTAQSFSESYMAGMLNDTANKTNRTTYLISSDVPLV